MKEILLSQGKTTQVSDEDYDRLIQHTWCAWKHRNTFYAVRNIRTGDKRSRVYMHREILNAGLGEQVDHEDQDGLNNQRSNIRIATGSENQCNRGKPRSNSTGFKGVYLNEGHSPGKPYMAAIRLHNRSKHLGYYKTAEEAAHAYDEAARKLHGEFACLNFPTTTEGEDHETEEEEENPGRQS